jgi:glucokinase
VLADLCVEIIRRSGVRNRDVAAVAIGVPGLVDSDRGVVHELVNIAGFRNIPLKKRVERKTGLTVFVEKDVNLMALGELHYGAGRGARNMVCVTLGTGVGGGIVIDGKLYRGSSLSAGEMGHVPLNERGPRCNCGGIGCLESYIGNKPIARSAIRRIKRGERTIISRLVGGDLAKVTPEVLSRAAAMGDELAVSIWEQVAARLGSVLAGAVNLLNPDVIVIGGGVSKAGRFLFTPLRRAIRERALSVPGRMAKVVRAKLGQDAGLVGGAILVKLKTSEQEFLAGLPARMI